MKKSYKIRYITYVLRSLNLITQWFLSNQDAESVSSLASQTMFSALQDIQKGFTKLSQLYEIYGWGETAYYEQIREVLDTLESVKFRRY